MVGYIYKTTNKVNGKIYVGKRRKESFDIYYYGSGVILSKALIKYGKSNFDREILEWCESDEILCEREKFWISELDAQNPSVGYNIEAGGIGGRGGVKNSMYCYVHKDDIIIRVLKTDLIYYLDDGFEKGRGYGGNGLLGTKRTAETRKKMSESGKGKHNHEGKNNPCYGVKYKWVTDGVVSRRLPIDAPVPEGFRRGKTEKKYERTEKQKEYIERLKKSNSERWSGDGNPSRHRNSKGVS